MEQEPTSDCKIQIMPDIEPFVSTVDGSIVTGRRALREHNRRHNVTNVADYKNEWAAAARRRDRYHGGDPSFDRKRRVEHLKNAYDKLSRK